MRRVVVTGLGIVSPLSSTVVLGLKFWKVVPELIKLPVLIQMDILLIMPVK